MQGARRRTRRWEPLLKTTFWMLAPAVRTEIVVVRPDSAAKAFVGAGGVSPADAGSLIAFHQGGKWEYGRRFFFPGADAPCARHDARVCHVPCRPTPRACSDDVDRRLGGWQPPFPSQGVRRRAEKERCRPERDGCENCGSNRSSATGCVAGEPR